MLRVAVVLSALTAACAAKHQDRTPASPASPAPPTAAPDAGPAASDVRASAGDAPAPRAEDAAAPAGGADGASRADAPPGVDAARPGDAAAAPPDADPGVPTLFWLDIGRDRVWRANADGTGAHVIAMNGGISAPDGVAVDVAGGHVYWTNMGSIAGGANNASLQRTGLEGGPVETLVKPGSGVNTAKQMTIDHLNRKLYFCDREGAKVWRASFDGTGLEALARASSAPHHDFQQLVGIGLDVPRGQVYFTDKNARKIRRMGLAIPAGQTADSRTDVEELVIGPANAAPIDLHLDLDRRVMYWTDRQLGLVQRAGLDLPAGRDAGNRDDIKVVASGLPEAIGITMDHVTDTLYVTQADGVVSSFKSDGSGRRQIGQNGSTGITFERLPAR
jgi:sugar lactone lactonase YvrE